MTIIQQLILFYRPAEEFEYHPSALAISDGQLPHPQRRTVQYQCLRDFLRRDHRRSLCGKKGDNQRTLQPLPVVEISLPEIA
ncbi:hypothetical protein DPV78_008351 [Talaromyces pinophilus]|nr:hypothetical protein DPV78_008351 [Talaromyces pinophilus]